MTELPVTLYGTRLGELVRDRDRALLRWSPEAEERFGINSTVLSHGLRVGLASTRYTESFFGGLLPEGAHLDRLAAAVQVASNDLVGLLAAVGADLAGALVVGNARQHSEPEELSTAEVGALLDRADGFLVGGGGSAVPGVQRKLTLTRLDGRWMRGNGTVASTHILKPTPITERWSADAEDYLQHLAAALELAPFETHVEEMGDRAVLVVQRYDRVRTASGTIERLHQEDAAQALGLPWGGNDKFEQANEDANLRAIAGLLDAGRSVFDPDPHADRLRLLRHVTLDVAAGNSDAHAKNTSLLHPERGAPTLAPLYDVTPTALPYTGSTALALRINGVRQLPDVTVDDLAAEAVSWGIPEPDARAAIEQTLQGIIEATHTLVAHPSIEAHLPGYVRRQATNLAEGRAARIDSAVPLMSLQRIE